MSTFLKQISDRYEIDAIISKEAFRKDYQMYDIFYDTFDKEAYKEVVPKLVALFKSLNNGKPATTVIIDFKGAPTQLDDIDRDMIKALQNLGYELNEELYKSGMVLKEGKHIPILDILRTRASKIRGLDKLKAEYEKNKNASVKKVIEFYEEILDLGLIDNVGKIDITKLAIYENKSKPKMVFTYNLRAIASQSTYVGWTSCMNFDPDEGGKPGKYAHFVGEGASAGVFICYLVKAGDEYVLDHPTARVLFKPYVGRHTRDIIWKADKIYGNAPEDFRKAAQAVINKVLKPQQDVYYLTQDTYVDNIPRIHVNYDWSTISQKDLAKHAMDPGLPQDDRNLAVLHMKDQVLLTKILRESRSVGTQMAALDRIKNQTVINNVALNPKEDEHLRQHAITLVKNPKILEKIALDPKTDVLRTREQALESLYKIDKNNKLPEKIFLDTTEKTWFRKHLSALISDPKILEKAVLNRKEDKDLREELFLDHFTLDQKVVESLLDKNEPNLKLRGYALQYSTNKKLIEEIAADETEDIGLRKKALEKVPNRKLVEKIVLDHKSSNEKNPDWQKALTFKENLLPLIADDEICSKIASNEKENESFRTDAIKYIKNEDTLMKVAENSSQNTKIVDAVVEQIERSFPYRNLDKQSAKLLEKLALEFKNEQAFYKLSKNFPLSHPLLSKFAFDDTFSPEVNDNALESILRQYSEELSEKELDAIIKKDFFNWTELPRGRSNAVVFSDDALIKIITSGMQNFRLKISLLKYLEPEIWSDIFFKCSSGAQEWILEHPKFKDQKIIKKVALDKKIEFPLRELAIRKLNDIPMLKKIAEETTYYADEAKDRLEHLKENKIPF